MLYIGVLLLLVMNLIGAILIKISPQHYHDGFLLALLGIALVGTFGLRAMIWLLLGKRYQLSYVYPFLGINYVLSLFVGMLVFGEPFIWRRLFGAVIILLGVAILSRSQHRSEENAGPEPVP